MQNASQNFFKKLSETPEIFTPTVLIETGRETALSESEELLMQTKEVNSPRKRDAEIADTLIAISVIARLLADELTGKSRKGATSNE